MLSVRPIPTVSNQTAARPPESLSSAAADFYLMSSAAHFDIDALPFAQRMQAVLHGPLLPHVINLGQWNYSNTAGELVAQIDFQAMTSEEVQRLALRLQSQPHVTHLNLWGHNFGPEGMRLLAGPIAMQTSLHTLDLSGMSDGDSECHAVIVGLFVFDKIVVLFC